MESNEIKGGSCKVHACLNCSDAKLDINVMISGSVVVECDRCLDDCSIPVEYSGLLTVRFSDLQHDYDGAFTLFSVSNSADLTVYCTANTWIENLLFTPIVTPLAIPILA